MISTEMETAAVAVPRPLLAAGAVMPRVAGPGDITIYQGDDYSVAVRVKNPDGTDANLAGFTAQAQLRLDVADVDDTVDAEFTTTVTSPLVHCSLTHLQTTPLAGAYVWDLQVVSAAGMITTVIAGHATVIQEVTR